MEAAGNDVLPWALTRVGLAQSAVSSRTWGSPAALATEHAQIDSVGHDNGSLEDAGAEEQKGVWVGLT